MELTIGQLIKITLGIFVVVIVVGGLYFFSSYINDFFGNVVPNESVQEGTQTNNQIVQETLNEQVDCEQECGKGILNVCDKEECESLEGCKYEIDVGGVGSCISGN